MAQKSDNVGGPVGREADNRGSGNACGAKRVDKCNLVGDCAYTPACLYQIKTDMMYADLWKQRILDGLDVDASVTLNSGRMTRKLMGRCTQLSQKRFRITLYKRGMNLGTLVHEIAHISRDGDLITGHGRLFKLRHMIVCKFVMSEREALRNRMREAGIIRENADDSAGGG